MEFTMFLAVIYTECPLAQYNVKYKFINLKFDIKNAVGSTPDNIGYGYLVWGEFPCLHQLFYLDNSYVTSLSHRRIEINGCHSIYQVALVVSSPCFNEREISPQSSLQNVLSVSKLSGFARRTRYLWFSSFVKLYNHSPLV